MDNQPQWMEKEKCTSIEKWTDCLHSEAKRLFTQDGAHGTMIFCFNDNDGLIAIQPVPPKTDAAQIHGSIAHAVTEHQLFGVVLIGEAWAYLTKENDHTLFQILDGEMNVSDLSDEDKEEVLMVRMENREGESLTYYNEIIRTEESPSLGEEKTVNNMKRKWF